MANPSKRNGYSALAHEYWEMVLRSGINLHEHLVLSLIVRLAWGNNGLRQPGGAERGTLFRPRGAEPMLGLHHTNISRALRSLTEQRRMVVCLEHPRGCRPGVYDPEQDYEAWNVPGWVGKPIWDRTLGLTQVLGIAEPIPLRLRVKKSYAKRSQKSYATEAESATQNGKVSTENHRELPVFDENAPVSPVCVAESATQSEQSEHVFSYATGADLATLAKPIQLHSTIIEGSRDKEEQGLAVDRSMVENALRLFDNLLPGGYPAFAGEVRKFFSDLPDPDDRKMLALELGVKEIQQRLRQPGAKIGSGWKVALAAARQHVARLRLGPIEDGPRSADQGGMQWEDDVSWANRPEEERYFKIDPQTGKVS